MPVPVSAPALVACSHGTADPAGSAAVTGLVDAVRQACDVPVVEAFVDVHGPYVDDVVADLGGHVVVVPLLLAAGYHVRVDIARAVARWPLARVAPALAPDPRITEALQARMREAGVGPQDAVVLAAAGSSDDAAERSVRLVAAELSARHRGPVTVGYGAARRPRVADAVIDLRAAHPPRPVSVVSFLLATGHFHRRVLAAEADVTTMPLLDEAHPPAELVELVLDRYAATLWSRQAG